RLVGPAVDQGCDADLAGRLGAARGVRGRARLRRVDLATAASQRRSVSDKRPKSCDLSPMLKAVPDPQSGGDPRSTVPSEDDILKWAMAYLRHAPLSLAVREINRLVAFTAVAGEHGPVLDVGCGDGFWWTVREDHREVYGIDISAREIAQAQQRIHAQLTDVSR